MMTARDFLSALVEGVPDDEAVSVRARWLRLILVEATAPRAATDPAIPLTVEEVGRLVGRQGVTVRAWCAQGRFPNAQKLGKEWRVPRADLEAFLGVRRAA